MDNNNADWFAPLRPAATTIEGRIVAIRQVI
jgi:hypothetical protein